MSEENNWNYGNDEPNVNQCLLIKQLIFSVPYDNFN